MKKDCIIDYLKLFGGFTIMSTAIGLIVLLSKIYSASESLYIMLGYFPAIGILFGSFVLGFVYVIEKLFSILDRKP